MALVALSLSNKETAVHPDVGIPSRFKWYMVR